MDYPFMIELSLKCFNLSIAFLTNQKTQLHTAFLFWTYCMRKFHQKVRKDIFLEKLRTDVGFLFALSNLSSLLICYCLKIVKGTFVEVVCLLLVLMMRPPTSSPLPSKKSISKNDNTFMHNVEKSTTIL